MLSRRVAILGGGTMGSAIARGVFENTAAYAIPSNQIVIAEPDASKHAALKAGNESLVVSTAREALEALRDDGFIIIAVKPQMFSALAAEVGDVGPRLVISIMAGYPAATVHSRLGRRTRIVRTMPNLPLTHGHGMTGLCPGPGATPADLAFTRNLFGDLGKCIDIDESLMDALTAVAGSGPAYLFYLAEAMIRGAIEVGFDEAAARAIVKQTTWGAAWMLLEDSASPADLRRRITSKGGTTQAATSVLDQAGVAAAFVKAIVAARDRGRELSAL